MTVIFVTVAGCAAQERKPEGFEFKVYHLGTAGQPEWEEFRGKTPHGLEVSIPFEAAPNDAEQTLLVWQDNVKWDWAVRLNGKPLGKLQNFEATTITPFKAAPGTLLKGTNALSIHAPKAVDDIRVGLMRLDARPLHQILSQSSLEVEVIESPSGQPTPCRITIVDETYGALPPIEAAPDQKLAVRPGCVYTPDGRARILLAPGSYRVTAGKGFEYSIDAQRFALRKGEVRPVKLTIRREVPTPNLVACDTHIHTLQFSGHGDSTAEERAITLAGEGIELPIATEHNRHMGYAEAAAATGMLDRYTPVIGNEVTTAAGHFNVFPVNPASPPPDWKTTDWPKLMESIRAVGARVIILNHARDIHSKFIPFGPENFNPVTGENRRGFEFSFDGMELINSGALRTDFMELFRDWFALLNYGYRITGVGSSDCHDVNRYIVGQGRTYIACKDTQPGRIDVGEATDNFVKGRALVSFGLLTQMTVGRFGVGDLATKLDPALEVEIRIFGPSWTRADRLDLFANGVRIRDSRVEGGAVGGEKARIRLKIPKPVHDVHLIAVASGPGVRDPAWASALPYQPSSPDWTPYVVGATNPIYLDGDGDGAWTPPRLLASRAVDLHGNDPAALMNALTGSDEAITAQAASLLHAKGKDIRSGAYAEAVEKAPEPIRRGFAAYIATIR